MMLSASPSSGSHGAATKERNKNLSRACQGEGRRATFCPNGNMSSCARRPVASPPHPWAQSNQPVWVMVGDATPRRHRDFLRACEDLRADVLCSRVPLCLLLSVFLGTLLPNHNH